MQGKQLRKLEAELWRAADQLRANSKLTASEYSMPVLGLIFLRHAYNRFQKVKVEVEKDLPVHPQRGKRSLTKKDFEEQNSMFLPEKSQFDYLVSLPESADIGEAIDNAMKLIEDEYDNLKGVLPKNFSIFSKDLLRELLRIFNKEVLQKAEGDLFGKIYEYFLGKFAMTGAQEGGEFFTPPSLVNTIVKIIEPNHGIVADIAVGSAGMFVQTAHFIEEEEGEEWGFQEGCLSIPKIREEVFRKEKVHITYYDENWNFHEEVYDGYAARIIQHEYDHIDGILFTDHLSPFKRRLLQKRLQIISKGEVDVDYRMKFPLVKKGR